MTADRHFDIDVLRGVALLGITVVNAPYFAVPIGAFPAMAGWHDLLAAWVTTTLAAGKFFPIFSFLFGFGLAAAIERAARDGDHGRVARRLSGLFVIGLAHALLLFLGDILMLYAAVGGIAWLVRNWSAPALARAALAVGILWVGLQATVVAVAVNDAGAVPTSLPGVGYLGGFWDAAAQRIGDWSQAGLFLLGFNGAGALSMVFLGMAARKAAAFPFGEAGLGRWRRLIVIAAVCAAVASAAAVAVLVGAIATPGAVPAAAVVLASVVLSLAAPALSLGIATSVLAWARRSAAHPFTRAMAQVGGSSLTGYLLHSVILGAVFLGWGLGLFGQLGPAAILGISLATFAAIMVTIAVWKRWFLYGPTDWLLRCVTDLRWVPVRGSRK